MCHDVAVHTWEVEWWKGTTRSGAETKNHGFDHLWLEESLEMVRQGIGMLQPPQSLDANNMEVHSSISR